MREDYSTILRYYISDVMLKDLNKYFEKLNLDFEGPEYIDDGEVEYELNFKSVWSTGYSFQV